MALLVTVHHAKFCYPVHPIGDRVTIVEYAVEHFAPLGHDEFDLVWFGDGALARPRHVVPRQVPQLVLKVPRTSRALVVTRHRLAQREVSREGANGVHRRTGLGREREWAKLFEGGEEKCRRAELHERRDLTHVGVPDDHVKASKTFGVAVRFVARVDDGTLERRLETHDLLKELRALGKLKVRVELEGSFRLRTHFSGPEDHLARDEVRHHRPYEVGELDVTSHEIVLVRAVGVTLPVRVVLIERDGLRGVE